MVLTPEPAELAARARSDLRAGLPVVIGTGAADFLALAAEMATPARLGGMRAAGGAVVAITGRRAATLRIAAYDGDLARIVLPADADCRWLHAIADPATDLAAPMKGPLRAMRDGDATAHRAAIALCKAARLMPAALVADGANAPKGLTRIAATVLDEVLSAPVRLSGVVSARVPLSVAEAGRLHVFRPDDGGEEHYAVEIGEPARDRAVLARLHSACFTGDLLGSLKCDCGPQLQAALSAIAAEGAGVLLYLNQEGRGIGLANKMRAYALQDQGFDTVEANHRLGFEDDERDFRIGAAILRQMGFGAVRLLTNNPAKVRMLRAEGLKVSARVPLVTGSNRHNRDYLAVKARKSGHLL